MVLDLTALYSEELSSRSTETTRFRCVADFRP